MSENLFIENKIKIFIRQMLNVYAIAIYQSNLFVELRNNRNCTVIINILSKKNINVDLLKEDLIIGIRQRFRLEPTIKMNIKI